MPMNKPRQPKLLDVVAVLDAPAEAEVEVGDVGTVVELLPPDGVEVEFLDRGGRTRCVTTLTVNDVLVLNRERTPVGLYTGRHSPKGFSERLQGDRVTP
jgi:hypothetical protein